MENGFVSIGKYLLDKKNARFVRSVMLTFMSPCLIG